MSARGQIVCVDSKPYRFKGASRDHGLEFWLLDRSRFVVGRGICFGPVRMEDVARELGRVREVEARPGRWEMKINVANRKRFPLASEARALKASPKEKYQ